MAVSSSSLGSNIPHCYTTTKSPNSCDNPYQYLLFDVVGTSYQGVAQNQQQPAEVLDRVLDKGIVIQGNCNLCCPDCNNIHFIASVETAMKLLFGSVYANNDGSGTCGSYTFSSLYCGNTLFYGGVLNCNFYNYSKCCNGFSESTEDLLCILNRHSSENGFIPSSAEIIDRFLDKGVVEYGTIEGESQLKYFVQWLDQLEGMNPNIEDSSYSEVIDRILDKGVVIWCDKDNGNYIIASAETFIRQIPCDPDTAFIQYPGTNETCCLNMKASVETSLKLLATRNCECGAPA